MANERNWSCRKLPEMEQGRALNLLGRCFPAYWEQLAMRLQCFPYDEISFVAEADGEIVGHVGIMPFAVSDGCGKSYDMAGIASVAVDPDWRGCGIAAELCRMALEWARREGRFASLPLYTGLGRVYEKSGWRACEAPPPYRVGFESAPPNSARVNWKRGSDLSGEERAVIVRFYESGEDFAGKVRRGQLTRFHDWPRMWREPDFFFAVEDSGYALRMEEIVAEAYFRPEISAEAVADFLWRCRAADGVLDVAMPECSRIWAALRRAGGRLEASPRDLMHGEQPMLLDLADGAWRELAERRKLYFPAGDKF